MNTNIVEDWLILLCLSGTSNEKLLNEIFKQIKDIETVVNLINLVQAVEASSENSQRLLELGGRIRVIGPVNIKDLYCEHCKRKHVHNTNPYCKVFFQ